MIPKVIYTGPLQDLEVKRPVEPEGEPLPYFRFTGWVEDYMDLEAYVAKMRTEAQGEPL